eukprot:CAMPEP_0119085570 /NCGR_PEP_ID=MMETSP1178-20130426/134398_1 /TAXON_ID=33656 /ORGANISM="unid sp, Strain CCMP2000" /LENGTH=162 /DNA_ID=CAMNT_0007068635 /DNA_START=204 /DNA_END=689 /DNA_ORIENTATION=+
MISRVAPALEHFCPAGPVTTSVRETAGIGGRPCRRTAFDCLHRKVDARLSSSSELALRASASSEGFAWSASLVPARLSMSAADRLPADPLIPACSFLSAGLKAVACACERNFAPSPSLIGRAMNGSGAVVSVLGSSSGMPSHSRTCLEQASDGSMSVYGSAA